MSLLKEKYNKEVIPQLKEKLGVDNILALPKITKISLNIGLGRSQGDPKFNEIAQTTLEKITGQKPSMRKARLSISSFKVREGSDVGMLVTLRGKRMNDFLDKFIHVTLPRVRDFRGLNITSVDQDGNLTIGIKEHIVFPEIESEDIEKIHGLEVSITTSATNREAGLALFQLLGFPFKKEEEKK